MSKLPYRNAGQPKVKSQLPQPADVEVLRSSVVQRYDSFNILTNVVWQWDTGRLVLLEWCAVCCSFPMATVRCVAVAHWQSSLKVLQN